ncbi:MAG: holliday junction helicase RuvA [Actinomycetota bacterium]|jgi:Holliday junction DNA helicase RuvA|nr:holliday junction helicase RuvA [Actinomycetota bacterium]
MIGFLDGRVVSPGPDGCYLDVNGVGYKLQCSATTMAALPGSGESFRMWVHTHVREDALALFGFATESERTMFEALIGVSGVGPKVALAICSALTPEAFRKALVTDDVDALATVPGIGKKTAGRIVLDLKERLQLPDLEVVGGGRDAITLARSALQNLGYSVPEIRAALGELRPADDDTVETIVRSALKALA